MVRPGVLLACPAMSTTADATAIPSANPKRWASLFGLCLLTGLVWLTASDISIALPTIGKEFGGRDHTTVIHAYEKVSTRMKDRRKTYEDVTSLIQQILAGGQA